MMDIENQNITKSRRFLAVFLILTHYVIFCQASIEGVLIFMIKYLLTGRSGGTGRRARFRSVWLYGLGGSTPPFRILHSLKMGVEASERRPYGRKRGQSGPDSERGESTQAEQSARP